MSKAGGKPRRLAQGAKRPVAPNTQGKRNTTKHQGKRWVR